MCQIFSTGIIAFLYLQIYFSQLNMVADASLSCGRTQYIYTKPDGQEICRRCLKCPRGMGAAIPCSDKHDTVCKPCPRGFFLKRRRGKCVPCRVCSTGTEVVRKCSTLRNTKCRRCKKEHYESKNNRSCNKCSSCPPGTFIVRKCTRKRDIMCAPCPSGFYSKGKGKRGYGRKRCKKCSFCPPGTYVEEKCTKTRDTICSPCPYGTYTDVTDSFPFCNICNHCRRFETIEQVCNATQNNVCGACRLGYFRLQSTLQCAECSPCNKDNPDTTVISDECQRRMPVGSRDICYPSARTIIQTNKKAAGSRINPDIGNRVSEPLGKLKLILPGNAKQFPNFNLINVNDDFH